MSSILDNFKHPIEITYPNAWIQINDFKETRDLSSPDNDLYLMDSIALACNLVNKYCERVWNFQELDEKFYVFTDRKVIYYLKAIPVKSIIYYYFRNKKGLEQQFDHSSVLLDPIEGMIEIGGLKGLYIVRYEGGLVNSKIPLEVKKATALLAKHIFKLKDREGLKSFSTQTYSQVWDTNQEAIQEVEKLLNPFKRVITALV